VVPVGVVLTAPPVGAVVALAVGDGAEMVRVWPAEAPPPGAGVKTETFRAPTAAMSLARMVAVSWV
jgi:hypothetical protein